jgi:hypothetical protein
MADNEWVSDPSFTKHDSDWVSDPTFKAPKGSKAESALRGAEQGLTFGFYDELSGAAEAAGQAIGLKGLGANSFSELGLQAPNGIDSEKLRAAYIARRDQQRAAAHDAQSANPGSYLTGEFAGGVAGGMLIPGGQTKTLGQAMRLGAAYGAGQGLGSSEAKDIKGMALDTGLGALFGLGGGAAAHGLEKGVAYGAKRAQPVIDQAKKWVGEKAQDVAESAAFKSTGAMLKDWRAARRDGSASKVGRYMLDSGELKLGDSVDDVTEKFTARKVAAGEKIGSIYENADEQMKAVLNKVGFDPKRDKNELLKAAREALGETEGADAAVNRLSGYLDEVAARHGDKPNEQAQAAYKREVEAYLPKLRNFMRDRREYKDALGKSAQDPRQPVLSGMLDDGQRTGSGKVQVELNGKPAEIMAPAKPQPLMTQDYLPELPTARTEAERVFGTLDDPFGKRAGTRAAEQLVPSAQQNFLDQHAAEQISMFGRQGEIEGTGLVPRSYAEANLPSVVNRGGQTRMPIEPSAPARPIRPDEVRNPMSLGKTNEVKGALDERIKYSRNPIQPDPAVEKAFYAARTKLSQNIDTAIESLGDDAVLSELKAANREYGMAKRVSDVARDRMDRESSHKWLGLTDTIVGSAGLGYGWATGDWQTAGAALLGKKAVEKYGTTAIALTADKISKRLLQAPQLKNLATSSPEVFKATVINLTRRALAAAEETRLPRAASNEVPTDMEPSQPPTYQEQPKEPTPLKGPEKWVADGFSKVAEHNPGLSNARDQMLSDPKIKHLLMQASDLKPGSKAMRSIIAQIKAELG